VRFVETAGALRSALRPHRREGASVGLVPTMGALHAGHSSLVARARDRDDIVVVSVFVNPLQFDRRGDLDLYPRDIGADLDLLESAGVDVCFAPSVDEMYPDGDPEVRVDPGPLGAVLEGASRPGHLAGVATVVTKLLCLVGPDAAYFGEKDFQQLAVVRRLVRDLSIPAEIVGCPIVREPDGLAMSSRNARLSPGGRAAATVLYRALLAGCAAWRAGARPGDAERAITREVATEPLAELDYAAAVDSRLQRLEVRGPGSSGHWPCRLLVAAVVDGVRLVDNVDAGGDGGGDSGARRSRSAAGEVDEVVASRREGER